MNKHEKAINKSTKVIDKNVSVFSTMISEAGEAIEQYDNTINELREEIKNRELLIADALQQRDIAVNLRANVAGLIG